MQWGETIHSSMITWKDSIFRVSGGGMTPLKMFLIIVGIIFGVGVITAIVVPTTLALTHTGPFATTKSSTTSTTSSGSGECCLT